MLNRVYKGHVNHQRHTPHHAFRYPVWYAWIDLDDIDAFCNSSRWISNGRFNLLSFYRKDYLPGADSLKASVISLLHEQTGKIFQGKVYLLTTLRQLGYTMNPISLYYCYESDNTEPAYVIAEVHNTPWGERHTYVLETSSTDRLLQGKEFHVSPFMPMDLNYEFSLPTPTSTLQVSIRLLKQEEPVFTANLDLCALPLTRESVRNLLMQHGWQSIKTVYRIYFQAMRLWLKRAQFFAHPDRGPSDNQDLRKSTT